MRATDGTNLVARVVAMVVARVVAMVDQTLFQRLRRIQESNLKDLHKIIDLLM